MHYPMTGYIHELTLIDLSGEVLLNAQCAGNTWDAAVQLTHLLVSHPTIIPYVVNEPRTCIPVRWFGFEIRTTLSMVAMETMLYNKTQPAESQQPFPWHIWWHHHFTTPPYLDPFEAMLPSTVRSAANFTPNTLAANFGLVANPDHSAARQQAEFARDLMLASGALAGLGS
jgi:hypothetical protein